MPLEADPICSYNSDPVARPPVLATRATRRRNHALGHRGVLALGLIALLLPGLALGNEFPIKPIRLMVGFAPGGSADFLSRAIAPRLGEALNTTVVVENKVGASGVICAEYVARSAPDGYTLLFGSASPVVIAPQTMPKAPFDALTDLAPINTVGQTPQVITVSPSLGVRNLKELIALARTRQVSLASAGAGGMTHLTIELLSQDSNSNFVHVPYKGNGPAINDALGGHINGLVSDLTPVFPLVQDGRLVAVAVTSEKRVEFLPNVPTANEDIPGFGATNWAAVFAPAKTPKALVDKINAALVKVVARDDVSAQFRKAGVVPSTMASPEAFQRFVADEFKRWGKLVREKNIVTTN